MNTSFLEPAVPKTVVPKTALLPKGASKAAVKSVSQLHQN